MNISSSGVKHINCSPNGEINPRGKVRHCVEKNMFEIEKKLNCDINVLPEYNFFLKVPRNKRAAKNSPGGNKGTISHLSDENKSKTLVCMTLPHV